MLFWRPAERELAENESDEKRSDQSDSSDSSDETGYAPKRSALRRAGQHVAEVLLQARLHLSARDDAIDQTMVEQEFGGLEARRQFGLGRVFDHSRSGKSDHGARFSDDQIADGRITR